jgi:hypothetical protein
MPSRRSPIAATLLGLQPPLVFDEAEQRGQHVRAANSAPAGPTE